jgi:hypothetical protein
MFNRREKNESMIKIGFQGDLVKSLFKFLKCSRQLNGEFRRADLFRDLKAEFGLSLLRSNYMIEGSLQGIHPLWSCKGWEVVPALGANVQFGDWLPKVGLARTMSSWRLGGWCWPTIRAIGIEVGHDAWKVGLAMDNIQWGLAKAVSTSSV